MKKIKLIAPILGAVTSLGTMVSLTSCGPEDKHVNVLIDSGVQAIIDKNTLIKNEATDIQIVAKNGYALDKSKGFSVENGSQQLTWPGEYTIDQSDNFVWNLHINENVVTDEIKIHFETAEYIVKHRVTLDSSSQGITLQTPEVDHRTDAKIYLATELEDTSSQGIYINKQNGVTVDGRPVKFTLESEQLSNSNPVPATQIWVLKIAAREIDGDINIKAKIANKHTATIEIVDDDSEFNYTCECATKTITLFDGERSEYDILWNAWDDTLGIIDYSTIAVDFETVVTGTTHDENWFTYQYYDHNTVNAIKLIFNKEKYDDNFTIKIHTVVKNGDVSVSLNEFSSEAIPASVIGEQSPPQPGLVTDSFSDLEYFDYVFDYSIDVRNYYFKELMYSHESIFFFVQNTIDYSIQAIDPSINKGKVYMQVIDAEGNTQTIELVATIAESSIFPTYVGYGITLDLPANTEFNWDDGIAIYGWLDFESIFTNLNNCRLVAIPYGAK